MFDFDDTDFIDDGSLADAAQAAILAREQEAIDRACRNADPDVRAIADFSQFWTDNPELSRLDAFCRWNERKQAEGGHLLRSMSFIDDVPTPKTAAGLVAA